MVILESATEGKLAVTDVMISGASLMVTLNTFESQHFAHPRKPLEYQNSGFQAGNRLDRYQLYWREYLLRHSKKVGNFFIINPPPGIDMSLNTSTEGLCPEGSTR